MLDLHAVTLTPGAGTTLGTAANGIPTLDGQATVGVPMNPSAELVAYGGLSPTADSIAILKLISQDLVDPINGLTYTPGTTSLWNIFWEWTKLKFNNGARTIQMGTNVGVVAALGALMDRYAYGHSVSGSRRQENEVVTPVTTFGAALTGSAWGQQAYAPATPLPSGKYAILGAIVTAITNAAMLRFSHANFGAYKPGFPVFNNAIISTTSWDKMDKSEILMSLGDQFVYMSEILGEPCCPVFEVGPSGTGLVLEMISVQADTPVVTVVLAKQ